jgi:hypothetical protein
MSAKGFAIPTLAFRKEERYWEGECLELGTATFAPTLQQTKKELAERIELYRNELKEAGERERFLRENNITLYTDGRPPKSVQIPYEEDRLMQPYRTLVGKTA